MGNGPLLAILLTVICHFVGIAALLAFAGGDILEIFRSNPGDDGGGEPRGEEPPAPVPGGGAIPPLPDAEQAPVRLREPGRIAPHYRRPRRPEHAPERIPARDQDTA